VLNQYLREEGEVVQRARDLVQERGLAQGELGRLKQLVAEQRGIKVGEDALDYVLDQLVKMLMHSSNVDEVYGEDHELRRHMRMFLQETQDEQQRLDEQVRSKLKHVSEGSRMWEIEYQRMKEDIQRRRGT
jgi:hypothetical protein